MYIQMYIVVQKPCEAAAASFTTKGKTTNQVQVICRTGITLLLGVQLLSDYAHLYLYLLLRVRVLYMDISGVKWRNVQALCSDSIRNRLSEGIGLKVPLQNQQKMSCLGTY